MLASRNGKLALSIVTTRIATGYIGHIAIAKSGLLEGNEEWNAYCEECWTATQLPKTVLVQLPNLLYDYSLLHQLEKWYPTRSDRLSWKNVFVNWLLEKVIGQAVRTLLDILAGQSIDWRPDGFSSLLGSLPLFSLLIFLVPLAYRLQARNIAGALWMILFLFMMRLLMLKRYTDGMADGKAERFRLEL